MEIHVDGWSSNIRFSSAHFIPKLGKCSRIHGHDYGVRIRLHGEKLNGILIDFTDLKKAIRDAITDLDHKLLVPTKGVDSTYSVRGGEVEVKYEGKRIVAVRDDVHLCDVEVTSSEELSLYIAERIRSNLGSRPNLTSLEVSVEEGPGQGAFVELGLNE